MKMEICQILINIDVNIIEAGDWIMVDISKTSTLIFPHLFQNLLFFTAFLAHALNILQTS